MVEIILDVPINITIRRWSGNLEGWQSSRIQCTGIQFMGCRLHFEPLADSGKLMVVPDIVRPFANGTGRAKVESE